MLNFGNRQTTLDLNGPVLSILQQPSDVSIVNAGVATFVAIGTATFPVQVPANEPSNTGILTQRWYVDGFGPLSDGVSSTYGFSVTGSATTTLTISNATGPANGLNIFMRPDYIHSAYSQPVGTPVTVGTARSTGNGNNEPFDSSNVVLTVFPTLTIITQPTDATVPAGTIAIFTVEVEVSDNTSVSYQWYMDGEPLSDDENTTGSNTDTLEISRDTIGERDIYVVITHPTSGDSPLTSNTVAFNVVDPRQIIIFENYYGASSATITEKNLFDGQVVIGSDIGRSLLGLYAAEKDLDIEMELHGTKGAGTNGGVGGYAKIRFTMHHKEEYVFAGLAPGFIFLYRKARLMAAVGRGGDASNSAGGDGGGLNQAGKDGAGRGGGTGGVSGITVCTSSNGVFGSYSGISPPNGADGRAAAPAGGRVILCPRGAQLYSPCNDSATVFQENHFLWGGRTAITNTGKINRGFKQGYGIRQTDGLGQGGGRGGNGATGGAGGTSGGGGGGGGGYFDNSATIVENVTGGSQYDFATVVIRLQNKNPFFDVVFSQSRTSTENIKVVMTLDASTGDGPETITFGSDPGFDGTIDPTITHNIQKGAVYNVTSVNNVDSRTLDTDANTLTFSDTDGNPGSLTISPNRGSWTSDSRYEF